MSWVVGDSLWNVSCGSRSRRHQLAESWAQCTLKAISGVMELAPPLIVPQVYNQANMHWVLRLLLVSPKREYLCLRFDPLCSKPHVVGANIEELAIMELVVEQEGFQPR